MNNYIPVKIVDSGGFLGLDTSEWIQLASVIIAMIATLLSFVTVRQQKKQFFEQQKEHKKNYWPIYKIQFFDNIHGSKTKYFFILKNIGFPYFKVTEVKWIGENEIEVNNFFNTEIENSITTGGKKVIKDKYDALYIQLDFKEAIDGIGHIEINGYGFDHQPLTLKTKSIHIENKAIKNHIELGHTLLEVNERIFD